MNKNFCHSDSKIKLTLDVSIDDARWDSCRIFRDILSHSTHVSRCAIINALRKIPGKCSITISLLLANNTYLKKLNNDFRQINRPTNVLSFPFQNFRPGLTMLSNSNRNVFLGDIAISFDKILEEHSEVGKDFQGHFNHILVHGILHLAGYDHQDDHEAAIMHSLEQKILSKI
jgi:probable rRNA maturation factor